MAKTYRRFIRIDGQVKASPQFTRRGDADEWYTKMLKKKHFDKHDLEYDDADNSMTVIEWSRKWMTQREAAGYPLSTTKSDEQRLRDYILPSLAEVPMAKVTHRHVHQLLKRISQIGYRIKDKTISSKTRTKVQVLLSTLFVDAMNEEPPIVTRNPVAGVRIKEKRKGKKAPVFLATTEDCLSFMKAAREIGGQPFVAAAVCLMAGLRKQELIALRIGKVDLKHAQLVISEKYQQAGNLIVPGTKSGEDEGRIVPIPGELVRILRGYIATLPDQSPDAFLLADEHGHHYNGRDIYNMIQQVAAKAGLKCTVHGLRHTYGREFAMRSGNRKALQAILGHSSSATTDIYSEIAGDRIRGFGEVVSFETGVKKSEG